MSSTMLLTILPKAAPMITPTAMSTTLPFTANALNSFRNLLMFVPYLPYLYMKIRIVAILQTEYCK